MRLDRIRALLLGWLLVLGADGFSLPAQTNQLDSDIRLFTVLTAINLAGYDDGRVEALAFRRSLQEACGTILE